MSLREPGHVPKHHRIGREVQSPLLIERRQRISKASRILMKLFSSLGVTFWTYVYTMIHTLYMNILNCVSTTRECCIIILYHAIYKQYSGQHNGPESVRQRGDIRAEHDEKGGCNTCSVKYTAAFQYSDWLQFLWHDIKCNINIQAKFIM